MLPMRTISQLRTMSPLRALTSTEMLVLWERGQGLHPLDQGLFALSAVCPGTPAEVMADMPLGERNRALAELRMACFGPQLNGTVACPECGEKLEFELDTRDLIANAGAAPETISVDGHTFRLPTSRDIALAALEADLAEGTRVLAERCTVKLTEETVGRTATHLSAGQLSAALLEEVGEQMALADPLAEPRLSFVCALCGHGWDELLEITDFLWTEIEVQVRRLLMDVHTLASAYGWSESEILSMGDYRRAIYLQMVRA